ncbi:hypothetical protein, partial [Paracoccus shanxieyensis]
RSRNPKLVRRSTVTASVTNGRALRYAEGSARGLLHHVLGHCHPAGECFSAPISRLIKTHNFTRAEIVLAAASLTAILDGHRLSVDHQDGRIMWWLP